MNKKVLILGGAGFLGGALVKAFTRREYHVTVGDLTPLAKDSLANFAKADVLDFSTVEKAIQSADLVINCSGQVSDSPDKCLNLNYRGIRNIAKAVKSAKCPLI